MEKIVMGHLKTIKRETLDQIHKKLKDIEQETKQRVMRVLSEKSYKDLLDSTMSAWKEESLKKIDEDDRFDAGTKKIISDLIKDSKVISFSGCGKMTDQFPTSMNSRFVMWLYFFLRCPDPRIDTLRTMIEADGIMNIYLFCISIAELYTMTSNVFHPASLLVSREKLTVTDVLYSLENDYDVSEHSILKTAEILFSVDVNTK